LKHFIYLTQRLHFLVLGWIARVGEWFILFWKFHSFGEVDFIGGCVCKVYCFVVNVLLAFHVVITDIVPIHPWIRRLMIYYGNLWTLPLRLTTLTMARVPLPLMLVPQAIMVHQQGVGKYNRRFLVVLCLVLMQLVYLS